jgi:TetR/AcrR family transcriptional regulator, tetracycline repressor protein
MRRPRYLKVAAHVKEIDMDGEPGDDRDTDIPHRQTLSRERIIVTAIAFVDENGLSALTMRRLGKELGVEAMSLYRHVNGREDLLEGIVDRMVAQLQLRPDGDELGPADGWQAYLQWLAHGVRTLAREHPRVFPLIATRHPAAPWLRPPLRSLRVVEDFLTMLISRGFSDTRAVTAYRAFSSFLLGHLLLEVTHQGVVLTTEDEAEAPPADGGDVALEKYPNLRELEPLLDQDETVTEFEEALESLLDRLNMLVPRHRRRSR